MTRQCTCFCVLPFFINVPLKQVFDIVGNKWNCSTTLTRMRESSILFTVAFSCEATEALQNTATSHFVLLTFGRYREKSAQIKIDLFPVKVRQSSFQPALRLQLNTPGFENHSFSAGFLFKEQKWASFSEYPTLALSDSFLVRRLDSSLSTISRIVLDHFPGRLCSQV